MYPPPPEVPAPPTHIYKTVPLVRYL